MISTTTDDARFEIINYINSIFHTWQKNTQHISELKSSLGQYFDNLSIEVNKDKAVDSIKAAVELMDDLWKKAHPTLKRAASIGIQIKFSNLVEVLSDEKHMELEENDDENNGNSKPVTLPISKPMKPQDRQLRSTTVHSRSTANEPTTTSTSDGEENEEETSRTPPPVLPKRVKRKIIVSSSEEEQEVEQPSNRKNRSSRARSSQTTSSRSTMNTPQLSGGKRKGTIPTASRKKQPKVSEKSS
ncbi:6164_t:CDS:2 [Racocetra fulgida]|uniref:6164_t:CDS:1 n=1 Tax=Racocetra fulgida TaxID=60492 RepID=A0A9N9EC16_9GLOM|nr:6164_t:CDS:2 [Racocetra fulgida]